MNSLLGQTFILYLICGLGVAGAVYVSGTNTAGSDRWFRPLACVPFWPLFLPSLLGHQNRPQPADAETPCTMHDDLAAAIQQVDAELDTALSSLDGWAEDVLARERGRLDELRTAWTAQAQRIREMDRLLAMPEYMNTDAEAPAGTRLWQSRQARRQNIQRLHDVRQRAYDDLMGTLAWVRELASMIHLAKFTGAAATRGGVGCTNRRRRRRTFRSRLERHGFADGIGRTATGRGPWAWRVNTSRPRLIFISGGLISLQTLLPNYALRKVGFRLASHEQQRKGDQSIMAPAIRQWVGERPRGRGWHLGNDPFDVQTVQRLLRAVAHKLNNPDLDPIMTDGTAIVNVSGDPRPFLADAIKSFQKEVLKSKKPDGRIDPDSKTWKALLESCR